MKNWLSDLFSSKPKTRGETPPLPAEDISPADQNELQTLRLELDESQRQIETLRQEVERLRIRQDELVNSQVSMRLEGLYTDLSAPASQILTQASLVENQSRQVQAHDILTVAKRMVRMLERNGMIFEGKPGEHLSYDPARHAPVHNGKIINQGQAVIVRFSGVSYQGKMIYKAIVEQENECRED
jgi:molecular chaperone GrpE (heat shock protein)